MFIFVLVIIEERLLIPHINYNLVCIKLDKSEFHNVFEKYYVSLCLFANQYLNDSDAAADIVQDVFVKLWQIKDDFFYLHQVKSFLYTAVKNKALNEIEHSRVVSEYTQRCLSQENDQAFHDAVIEEETYRILLNTIEQLPPQMKAIMKLALDGKKNAEIAEALNISKETVHTLKKNSYKKLRVLLKEHYYLIFLL